MSNSENSSNPINVLGNIASIIGLLGISLYFTGWIYRWAYYGFYQLEVTTLDLPQQSFLLVPIQVLFGNYRAIFNTVIAIILTPFLIRITFGLLTKLRDAIRNHFQKLSISYAPSTKTTWIHQLWQSFTSFALFNFRSIQLKRSLLYEIIIVFWVLLILFHLARHQGTVDAKRDTINTSSTLPVVTLVTPKSQLILGKKLESIDPFLPDPDIKDYNIIGDVGLAKKIQRESINELKEGRVWRLLIERNGWIYVFPTLTENDVKEKGKPALLAIPKGASAEQLMIISPDDSSEQTSH